MTTITITASMVNELRQKTNSGMMDCKKALAESAGDMQKAIEILRIKGQMSAGKRADRSASEGTVLAKLGADGKSAALVQLGCETDFVARNESFQAFAQNLADLVLSAKQDKLENLQASAFAGGTLESALTQLSATIGEKIEIGQLAYRAAKDGFVQTYIHPGAKLGVLVVLEQASVADADVAKDLAMQIAAATPLYVAPGDVPAEARDAELNVIKETLRNEGKPEAMLAKIAEGKINKFYSDVCLLKQAFVKNPELSIEKQLASVAPKVQVAGFVRFAIGK